MTKLSKKKAVKYLAAMEDIKKKYITVYDLAQKTGIIENVIQEDLAFFDPMIRLNPTLDLTKCIPGLTKLANKGTSKKVKAPLTTTVAEFVFTNMTVPGGLIDCNCVLSEKQLKELKKIINITLKGMKK